MFFRTLANLAAVLVFAATVQAGNIVRHIDRAPVEAAAGVSHFAPTQVKGAAPRPAPRPAPPKSIHFSAPRPVAHHPAIKNAVKHAVHKAVVNNKTMTTAKPPVKTTTTNVAVNRTTTTQPANPSISTASATTIPHSVNATPAFPTRTNYTRPNTANGYYNQHRSYHPGMHNWRHSRYRRHQHRNPNIVRGIVEGTTGNANKGEVQVKVLRANFSRFRNKGQKAVAANNGANGQGNTTLRNYQVNNGTHYQILANNQGAFKNGSFKSLKQGEPVMIMLGTNRSATLAQAIEIFPMNKKLAAKQ